ncbi:MULTISPECIES: hypothetical protein [unclassified Bacillus (in: firmicutes)]|uniref:hypothetical protein n=1 Tax=unclassified Bacillus (in: firmicutes) TaxID=185979 RepID=UPI0033656A2D
MEKHTPQYREPAYTSTVPLVPQEQELQRNAEIHGKNTTANLTLQWLTQMNAAAQQQTENNEDTLTNSSSETMEEKESRIRKRKTAEVAPDSEEIKNRLTKLIENDTK